jgi:hypothetical protein
MNGGGAHLGGKQRRARKSELTSGDIWRHIFSQRGGGGEKRAKKKTTNLQATPARK